MSEHVAPAGQRTGILISTPKEGGPVVQQDTIRCMHCQRIFVWVKGSGKKRGWCMRCNGFTCGSTQCDPCVHFMQKIENLEAGRPEDYKPIRILVPGEVPRQ